VDFSQSAIAAVVAASSDSSSCCWCHTSRTGAAVVFNELASMAISKVAAHALYGADQALHCESHNAAAALTAAATTSSRVWGTAVCTDTPAPPIAAPVGICASKAVAGCVVDCARLSASWHDAVRRLLQLPLGAAGLTLPLACAQLLRGLLLLLLQLLLLLLLACGGSVLHECADVSEQLLHCVLQAPEVGPQHLQEG
jgi:hypothetical protein